jgi:hypothetical protein
VAPERTRTRKQEQVVPEQPGKPVKPETGTGLSRLTSQASQGPGESRTSRQDKKTRARTRVVSRILSINLQTSPVKPVPPSGYRKPVLEDPEEPGEQENQDQVSPRTRTGLPPQAPGRIYLPTSPTFFINFTTGHWCPTPDISRSELWDIIGR